MDCSGDGMSDASSAFEEVLSTSKDCWLKQSLWLFARVAWEQFHSKTMALTIQSILLIAREWLASHLEMKMTANRCSEFSRQARRGPLEVSCNSSTVAEAARIVSRYVNSHGGRQH